MTQPCPELDPEGGKDTPLEKAMGDPGGSLDSASNRTAASSASSTNSYPVEGSESVIEAMTNGYSGCPLYVTDHAGTSCVFKPVKCPPGAAREVDQAREEHRIAQDLPNGNTHIILPFGTQEAEDNTDIIIDTFFGYRVVSLSSRISEVKADEIMHIARKTLKPLALLERKHTFHSDIKPSNILVNTQGEYAIIYFEPSKRPMNKQFDKAKITLDGEVIGLDQIYAPPEAFSEYDASLRVRMLNKIDVYCWGMTLYELITKKTPDKLKSEARKYKYGRTEPEYEKFLKKIKRLSLPGDRSGILSKIINAVLYKVLAFNPEDRPSFAELYQIMGAPDPANPSHYYAPSAEETKDTTELRETVEWQKREIEEYARKLGQERGRASEREKNAAALESARSQREAELTSRVEANMALLKESLKHLEHIATELQKSSARKDEEVMECKRSLEKANKKLAKCCEDVSNLKLAAKDKDLEELKKQVCELQKGAPGGDTANMRLNEARIAGLRIEDLQGQVKSLTKIIDSMQEERKAAPPTPAQKAVTYPFKHNGKVLRFEQVQEHIATLANKLNSECNPVDYSNFINTANAIVNNNAEEAVALSAPFRDTGAQIIALYLRCSFSLIVLSLGCCQIGPVGAQALGQAIQNHQSLQELYLGLEYHVKQWRDSLGMEAMTSEVPLFMPMTNWNAKSRDEIINTHNKQEKLTKENWNRIGLEGTRAIAEGVKNNGRITHLDFSMTGIGDAEVKELVDALKVNTSVKKLYLYLNDGISDKSGSKYGFRGGVKVVYNTT